MDNYYSDKYSLDDYAKRNPRERKTSSSGKSSRPLRSELPRSKPRPKKEKRPPKPVLPKKVSSKNKPKPVKIHKQKKTAYKPKPVKKTKYRAPRKKKTPGQRVVTAIVTVLIVGIITAGACVLGYNIIRENKKKQPFKFSENVKISGINIGGLSMDDAKKKLEKNQLKAVDDIKLTILAKDKKKTYSKSDFSYKFDYDTPLQEAKIYSLKEQGIYDPPKGSTEPQDSGELKMPKLKLEYEFDKTSAAKLSKKIAKEVDSKPVNAKVSKFNPFSDDRFEYKEGIYGYDLDEKNLESEINKFMTSKKSSGTIDATGEQISPDITVDDLQNNIVGLATASTVSYNTENGNTNMAIALKACNGSIIEPGDTWSFNNCTGDSNDPANGYKKATVITDRKLEEGYGGGICQASTTIYQAAMFANMDIVERHNHYWASGYADSGEDATIDYDNLDLKLTNTTGYQMFIECRMEGTTLICNIYGVQEDYYDNVKIYTKNRDIVKKKSYSTDTYRVLYLDGKIVSEEIICQSDYSLSDGHVVQDADKGTFRTTVNGVVQEETNPSTEPSTSSTEDSTGAESSEAATEQNE